MPLWIEQHASKIMLCIIGIFALHFGWIALIDHYAFRTAITDLAHMEQALWSITQGDFWMTMSHPYMASRLVQHANLIFYLLAPLYALLPYSETLLLLSVASVSVGSWLLFLLARHLLNSSSMAILMGTSLLLSPPVQELVLFDFHPHVLAIPLLIGALLALEQQKTIIYWTCIILLLTVKEDIPLLLLFLSPFIVRRSSWKIGLMTAGIALFYFIGLDLFLDHMLADQRVRSPLSRFSHLGATWIEIVQTCIFSPSKLLHSLNELATVHGIFLFIHGGFLAALSPLVLLAAVPNIAQNILANTPYQAQVTGVYYSGVILTIILAGCLYSFVFLQQKNQILYSAAVALFSLQIVIITTVLSPLPYGVLSQWSDYTFSIDRESFRRIAKQIPPDAGLATQRFLGPHFARRKYLFEYPQTENADYILLMPALSYTQMTQFSLHREEIIFGVMAEDYMRLTSGVFDNPDFGVVDFASPFYLLQRGYSDRKNAEAHTAYTRDIVLLQQSL